MAGGTGALIARAGRGALAVLVLLGGTALGPTTTAADPTSPSAASLRTPRAYYRPVVVDGMTFPVARATWLSVIRVREDWHDPRFRVVDGRWRLVGFHEGNDIMAEEGTPIVAMLGGQVEQVGWTFYSGTRVGIRGTDGRYYLYAHLSDVASSVVPGTTVGTGDLVGSVGNTGYGAPGRRDRFPPHLHLGIQDGGTWVNPYPTVRRLYEASVRATARGEHRMARLAERGMTERWERVAERLYAGW